MQSVLLIEKNRLPAALLEEILQPFCLYYCDLAEALSLADKIRPDLLLCPADLPEEASCRLVQSLRQQPALAGVKIVLFSAVFSLPNLRRAMNCGADDFLPHDLPAADLTQALLMRLAAKPALPEPELPADRHPASGWPDQRALFSSQAEKISCSGELTCLLVDIDRFRNLNYILGNKIATGIITEIARRLENLLAGLGPLSAYQLSDDKFVILLHREAGPAQIDSLAQKITATIREPFGVEKRWIHLTAGIGASTMPRHAGNLRELVNAAETALVICKDNGSNGHVIFHQGMKEEAIDRFQLHNSLHEALHHNEILVYYQPLVDALDGNITGLEALVRWQHPELGLLPPDRFVGLAEESSLINSMGIYVLEKGMAMLKERQKRGKSPLKLSVNVSARQLRDENLLHYLQQELAAGNIVAEQLEIELTESSLIHDNTHLLKLLADIRQTGVSIVIDDFGTGYSALSYLKKFPVNKVKMDMSFVHQIPENLESCSLAQSIVEMAHSLRLAVVAEGVENREQAEYLRYIGCDELQGYYFSKPVPAGEIDDMLAHISSLPGSRPAGLPDN